MLDIFERIKFILSQYYSFHSDQIEDRTRFYEDLGTDSLEMLQLISDFEEEFKIQIELEAVEKMVSIEDVVRYIKRELTIKKLDEMTLIKIEKLRKKFL